MIDWVLILGFLVTTVGGFIAKKGLDWGDKKIKELLDKKIKGGALTKSQAKDIARLSELLSVYAAGFKKHFNREFKKWRATLGKDEQEALKKLQDAVSKLEVMPRDIEAIIQKAIRIPVPLFNDLDTFLERVDKELRETKFYVPRADELEILDQFLKSNDRLLIIHGERGVGKTRLLVEYARRLTRKKKRYRFCSIVRASTHRECATDIEELGQEKGFLLLADELESLPNRDYLFDFLLDPSRLDIQGKLKMIGCTVYPDAVKRDDLRSWTQVYELGKFEDPEGLEEIARKNFPEDAEQVDLGRIADLSEGFPDAVIAAFHMLKEEKISWDELGYRDEILNTRFEKLYEEAGEHAPALAILAAIRVVWDAERKLFNEFYSDYGVGTFAHALNDDELQHHIALATDRDGEPVRVFRSRELFARYLMQRFFFDPDGRGNLATLARVAAKTWSARLLVERILTFQDDEKCKERCDKAILKLLEAIQEPDSHTEALFSVLDTLDDRYARRGILRDMVDWKRLKGRLQELTDPADRAVWGHNMGVILQKLGEPQEAKSWYQESLEIKKELGNKSGIAQTLHQLGMLAQNQGDYEEARKLYKEAKDAFEELGEKAHVAAVLHQLGLLAQQQGDYKEAKRLYEESLEIEKELGDKSGIAQPLHQLGMLAHDQGDYKEAKRLYEEAKDVFEELGEKANAAAVLHQLGLLAEDQGNYDEARKLYQESLEIQKELGDKSGIAYSLGQLGSLAYSQGNYPEARRLYGEVLDITKELGDKSGVAKSLHQLGLLAQGQGDYDEARKLYKESLEIAKELGDKRGIATTLGQLGRLAEYDGNEREAFIFYLQALSIFAELKDPDAKLALSDIARLRERVGPEEFKKIVEEAGKKLDQDLSSVLKWFEPKD